MINKFNYKNLHQQKWCYYDDLFYFHYNPRQGMKAVLCWSHHRRKNQYQCRYYDEITTYLRHVLKKWTGLNLIPAVWKTSKDFHEKFNNLFLFHKKTKQNYQFFLLLSQTEQIEITWLFTGKIFQFQFHQLLLDSLDLDQDQGLSREEV